MIQSRVCGTVFSKGGVLSTDKGKYRGAKGEDRCQYAKEGHAGQEVAQAIAQEE